MYLVCDTIIKYYLLFCLLNTSLHSEKSEKDYDVHSLIISHEPLGIQGELITHPSTIFKETAMPISHVELT